MMPITSPGSTVRVTLSSAVVLADLLLLKTLVMPRNSTRVPWVLGCCAEYSSGVGVDAVCDTTVSSIRTKVGGQKLEDK